MNDLHLPNVKTSVDLLVAVPALLGYWPTDSIVLALAQGTSLQVTMRIDTTWFINARQTSLQQLRQALSKVAHTAVYVLGYGDDLSMVELSILCLFDDLDIDVTDVLITDDRRWWSLMCDQTCCPSEGRPFERDRSVMSAAAVYAGVPIHRKRHELVARVHASNESALDAYEAAAKRVRTFSHAQATEELLASRDLVREGFVLDDEQRTLAAALLQDTSLTLVLFAMMRSQHARADTEWLLQICDQAPKKFVKNPLALVAMAAWLGGGGPLVTEALKEVFAADPDHPVAGFVANAIEHMKSPAEEHHLRDEHAQSA